MTEFDIGKKAMVSQTSKNIKLINGNCLNILPTLEANSVDLVLTDLHINIQKDMSLKRHK